MPGAVTVCPGCGHPAREHGHDVGCVLYTERDTATKALDAIGANDPDD